MSCRNVRSAASGDVRRPSRVRRLRRVGRVAATGAGQCQGQAGEQRRNGSASDTDHPFTVRTGTSVPDGSTAGQDDGVTTIAPAGQEPHVQFSRRGRPRAGSRALPRRPPPPRRRCSWPTRCNARCSSRALPGSVRPSSPKPSRRPPGRKLIRLQCYEGLDEARALYEWNYRKQLLAHPGRLRRRSRRVMAADRTDDIFSEQFLLSRPLLSAIRRDGPTVLLIDEADKTDVEVEALLLEVLAEFQVTIPELGTVTATRRPFVVVTSNATRELSEALKRRCLYLYLDYPTPERERDIIRAQVPDVDEALAEQIARTAATLRAMELKKAPSIAETIDWARTLLALGMTELDEDAIAATLGVVLKHRSDHGPGGEGTRVAGTSVVTGLLDRQSAFVGGVARGGADDLGGRGVRRGPSDAEHRPARARAAAGRAGRGPGQATGTTARRSTPRSTCSTRPCRGLRWRRAARPSRPRVTRRPQTGARWRTPTGTGCVRISPTTWPSGAESGSSRRWRGRRSTRSVPCRDDRPGSRRGRGSPCCPRCPPRR